MTKEYVVRGAAVGGLLVASAVLRGETDTLMVVAGVGVGTIAGALVGHL